MVACDWAGTRPAPTGAGLTKWTSSDDDRAVKKEDIDEQRANRRKHPVGQSVEQAAIELGRPYTVEEIIRWRARSNVAPVRCHDQQPNRAHFVEDGLS